MWDFPDVKFRVARSWLATYGKAAKFRIAYMISERAIRSRHPDHDPDRAQKFSSSMSQQLSTRNILSKSMHAFLSNLANRQTDKQTRAKHESPPLSELIKARF